MTCLLQSQQCKVRIPFRHPNYPHNPLHHPLALVLPNRHDNLCREICHGRMSPCRLQIHPIHYILPINLLPLLGLHVLLLLRHYHQCKLLQMLPPDQSRMSIARRFQSQLPPKRMLFQPIGTPPDNRRNQRIVSILRQPRTLKLLTIVGGRIQTLQQHRNHHYCNPCHNDNNIRVSTHTAERQTLQLYQVVSTKQWVRGQHPLQRHPQNQWRLPIQITPTTNPQNQRMHPLKRKKRSKWTTILETLILVMKPWPI